MVDFDHIALEARKLPPGKHRLFLKRKRLVVYVLDYNTNLAFNADGSYRYYIAKEIIKRNSLIDNYVLVHEAHSPTEPVATKDEEAQIEDLFDRSNWAPSMLGM